MEWIYLCFIIALFLLAISDLWVGVSNDAVNFLNSAVGAKAAKFKRVIIIAALGVFCGAVMSNGMMDIARHGIFHPDQFSFEEIMFIFLAVMVTDILLLDAFNSLGMPTSTTVSLVFELLGATVAFTLLKMSQSEGAFEMSQYLNSSKALSVIIGIFVSVAIAFVVGAVIQWVSRMIFTFNYKPGLKWKIGIFGGIATTAIVYFMLLKGVKTMAFMTPDVKEWIASNTTLILTGCMVVFTLIMQLLHALKVNVFKVIVLIGTFSLATAFAGNDLVNFIGVPLAGLSSFLDWHSAGAGDPSTYMMDSLNESASTPFYFLFAAGVIMVIALATSKKAHKVTQTELNLAKQQEGEEMFGSSRVARSLVRLSNKIAVGVVKYTPQRVRAWVDKRFDKSYVEIEDGAQYDLVRASVNLVVASLLIALGTSLKLPLSTTYVTFMVAMATSLADRAWTRESAVYRITGVLSVIGGWFLTAAIAFGAAMIVALIMHWGGIVATAIIVIAGLVAMIHSNIRFKHNSDDENGDKALRNILNESNPQTRTELICRYVARGEGEILEMIKSHYQNITEGLIEENIKKLRRSFYELKEAKDHIKNMRRRETIAIRHMAAEDAMRKSAWFFTSFNNMEQIYYSLRRIGEPTYEHIDNNFTPLPERYAESLILSRNTLLDSLNRTTELCHNGEYDELKSIEERLSKNQKEFSSLRKLLVEDIRNEQVNMTVGYLYLNILQESEQIAILLKQMIRSSRKFQLS